ncbi:MAG: ammonia-forming cytochrome c nitrite reductase subunit c552 [Micrococcales bacterium]|nr:ammonia-forming cytochrome c nitrite reductase subunit c552 [Micrococcales bacterium]
MSKEMTVAPARGRSRWVLVGLVVVTAAITALVTALVVGITQRKSEGPASFAQVVELDWTTIDPEVWGQNFPIQYEAYLRTADFTPTTHQPALVPNDNPKHPDDPREMITASKIEEDPRLVTMWAGNPFSGDYRHLRGHEYMLVDQQWTGRVMNPEKPQPGACLNCHASTVGLMLDLGDGDLTAGFHAMNAIIPHADAIEELERVGAHPITCIDCHDPETMAIQITRPAAIEGIRVLKASEGIEDFDVNRDATRQEMRSFVCAQCHVEYYFAGEGRTVTFPWHNGIDIDGAWEYYEEIGFRDFEHAITGASILKMQHPEYEVWASGVHADNGVSCADCHMAYTRVGSLKVSNHQIASPMADVNGTCGTCHGGSTEVIVNRVTTIQNRFVDSRDRALDALVALIEDIEAAEANGTATPEQIEQAQAYHRFASMYVDYAYSENSYGFHAPDYLQRVLSQSLDASRKGQLVLRGVSIEALEPSELSAQHATSARDAGRI